MTFAKNLKMISKSSDSITMHWGVGGVISTKKSVSYFTFPSHGAKTLNLFRSCYRRKIEKYDLINQLQLERNNIPSLGLTDHNRLWLALHPDACAGTRCHLHPVLHACLQTPDHHRANSSVHRLVHVEAAFVSQTPDLTPERTENKRERNEGNEWQHTQTECMHSERVPDEVTKMEKKS